MMNFYGDTDVVSSISDRIASYSVSLLEAGKPSYMACSILSPVRALSCKTTLAPIWREESPTLKVH